MKKPLLAFALLFINILCAVAQKQGIAYFDENWDKVPLFYDYDYYRNWKQVDSLIEIEDYYAYGKLFQKGHVRALPMKSWAEREGIFTRYDRHGDKVAEGNFVDGKREGLWKYFLYSQTMPFQQILYKNDVMQYEMQMNDDGKFKVSEVQYADGSEVMRKQYDSAGRLFYYAALINDQSIITNYYPNGKVKRVVTTFGDSLLSDVNYGVNGEITKNIDTMMTDWGTGARLDSMAGPGYDFWEYLRKNITYHNEWLKLDDDQYEKAVCRLMIMEDGSIRMPYILKQSSMIVGEELLRIVSKAPKWKFPAKKNNKNVKCQVVIPFSMTNGFEVNYAPRNRFFRY